MSGKKHIKTWVERCEENPDHNGIVSERMIKARMQEEIDELREEYERLWEALGLAERLAEGRLAMVEQLTGEVEAIRRKDT